MKKVVVVGMYRKYDQRFGDSDGGTAYGHLLLYPEIVARRKFEQEDIYFYSEAELPVEQADIVLCVDLTEELYQRIKKLPSRVFKILQSCESVIYAPLSHSPEVIMDPVWDVVITWNRGFEAHHVIFYDIPFAGKTASGLPAVPGERQSVFKEKGVVIASNKGTDHRGYAQQRNRLYRRLAAEGYIDLYGHGWGEVNKRKNIMGKANDKIGTLKNYSYALVIENIWTSGYVTEKIADCILSGLPVIYMGDPYHANRRFPGTFTALDEISIDSFVSCRKQLQQNYHTFQQALQKAYTTSDMWCDSWLDALTECFRREKNR